MKKIKYFSLVFLALALVVGVGASSAGATLTLDALTITSSSTLDLSGAAASAITIGAATQTGTISVGDSTGAMTMNLASGNSIKTINLGTGTGVKTIHIGDNATPANVITIGGAASGTTVAGTLATTGNTTLGDTAADVTIVNSRVATGSVAGALVNVGASYAYGEGLEMRYGVDSWAGTGNSFKGYYFRTETNLGNADGGLRGMEIYGVSNITTGTTGLSNLQPLYTEMLVKSGSGARTITNASSIEANVSVDNQAATLTFTNNVYALKAKVQTGTGIADYTKMGGIAVLGRDDGTSRTFGNAISIEDPEATVATWTKGLSVSAATTTGVSLTGTKTTAIAISGTTTTGISIANTTTTGINFAGGAANQAIAVGTLSSTTPGSGAVISAANPRALDINVDDNDTASAQGTLLSAGRFRLMKYASSITEDYAVHGLVKYSALDKGAWGAGVMGAAETTGAVNLAGTSVNLLTGVLGRFGTAATLNFSQAADRLAAVTAFNNNSVALTGSGKSVGLLVMETNSGTPIDLDYGLEIQSNVATTGIIIGAATTGLNFSGAQTNNIVVSTAPTGTDGSILKAGTSGAYLSTATPDTKFLSLYLRNSATSGDNRGIYNRLQLTGTGGGGESLRSYTELTAASGTAHGAHITLGLGESTTVGSVTGLGVGVRSQLILPDGALPAGGTYAALQPEIYSFGTNSTPAAATELSLIRVVNDGSTQGKAAVDAKAYLMSLQGFTLGTKDSTKMVSTGADTTSTHRIKVLIGGTTYWLLATTDAPED